MKKLFAIIYISIVCIIFAVNIFINKQPFVKADAPTTSVQIQNTVPVFSGDTAEATASYATVPTGIGSTVTFQGTATDANTDQ